jgi:hypothetical protein
MDVVVVMVVHALPPDEYHRPDEHNHCYAVEGEWDQQDVDGARDEDGKGRERPGHRYSSSS